MKYITIFISVSIMLTTQLAIADPLTSSATSNIKPLERKNIGQLDSRKLSHITIKKLPAMRFTRKDDVVIDHDKKLVWADNYKSKVVKKRWFKVGNELICNSYKSHSPVCMDTSGDTAATYCSKLIIGKYKNWRLPSQYELQMIRDKSNRSNRYINSAFKNTILAPYWCSGSVGGADNKAFGMYGKMNWIATKSTKQNVRCVHSL